MKKLYLFLCLLFYSSLSSFAQFKHIKGPSENGQFGSSIVVLPNGNYAVSDPKYDEGGLQDIGAVFVYNGKTHELIASLKGSSTNDLVGQWIHHHHDNTIAIVSYYWNDGKGAITFFPIEEGKHWKVNASNSLVGTKPSDINSISMSSPIQGKTVIVISSWNENRGAVVIHSNEKPLSGVISASNAFVGKYPGDKLGARGFQVVGQKVIVMSTSYHENRGSVSILDLHAAVGEINPSNSLIGERPNDQVGTFFCLLKNQTQVAIGSSYWNEDRGAATLIELDNPTVGYITADNSLIGTNPSDRVSASGLFALENGNYVVASSQYNQRRGAATHIQSNKPITGIITPQNSLVGQEVDDLVGYQIQTLPNGHFLTVSPNWNHNRGAVTWADGEKGIAGLITSTNSLIGSVSGTIVGTKVEVLKNSDYAVFSANPATTTMNITWGDGSKASTGNPTSENSLTGISNMWHQYLKLTHLTNGNAVLCNFDWNNYRGAVTFIKAGEYPTGPISAENSFVGENEYERVGSGGVVALTNGNYAFSSPDWSSRKGAVTWGNGQTGSTGIISSQNSLVGISTHPLTPSIYALSNGNYVVHTSSLLQFQNGKVVWGDGTKGTFGEVGESNSLTGDSLRIVSISPLKNGHYAVAASHYIKDFSTVTWMNGNQLATGNISAENSLVSNEYELGFSTQYFPIIHLNNDDFLIHSSFYNDYKGSVTWVDGKKGIKGPINETNSILGSSKSEGPSMRPVYNYPLKYLMVGRPIANTLSIFNPYHEVVTGLEEILAPIAKHTSLYPNPSTHYSAIKTNREQTEMVAIKIMNSLGQVLLFQNGMVNKDIAIELPVQSLTPGNYIVEVQGNDFIETHKLIKQ